MKAHRYECKKCGSHDVIIKLSQEEANIIEAEEILVDKHDIDEEAQELLGIFDNEIQEFEPKTSDEKLNIFVDLLFKFIALQRFFYPQMESFMIWFNAIYDRIEEIRNEEEQSDV